MFVVAPHGISEDNSTFLSLVGLSCCKQKCEKLGALIALLSWDANTDVVGVLLVMPDTTPGSCMFLAITRAGAVRVD